MNRHAVALFLFFAIAANAQSQPIAPPVAKKIAPVKLTPPAPKGGDLLIVSTDADDPLLDFHGVFSPTAAKQIGKELYVAVPCRKETMTYVVWNIYVLDKKIVKERVEIRVAGEAPKPKPPPVPVPDDVATQLKTLTAAINAIEKRVTAIETKPAPDIDAQFKEIERKLAVILKSQLAAMENIDALNKRVTVLEVKPPPPPPPVPVPTKKVKSLTFVVLQVTQQTANVTEDAELRKWLTSRGIGIYGITTQAQLDSVPKFAGITTPPCVVIQDEENNVITSLQLVNAESIKNTITYFMGK